MAISDSDLMMLENLTYCLSEKNPAFDFKLKALSACKTVGEYLEQFTDSVLTDSVLNKLDNSSGIYDGKNSGSEWAAMIRYMMSKKELLELKIAEVTEKVICFVNPNDNNKAIVAFRGTTDEEWGDNAEGFNKADTVCQKEAYEYIEGLPYDDITVVGHSKGGNKAQYVAIRSDKVTRCVSVDGQGFSQEFIDKYGPQIEKNASKITSYSLSTDFVHILMYTLPGIKIHYINGGSDVGNTGENHSPDALFEYYQDNNGEWHVKVNGDGNAYLDYSSEDTSMTMLHEFTTFVLNNMSGEDKYKTVAFLSGLLNGIFSEEWKSEQIIDYIKNNKDAATTVIAYLLKYIKLNDLDVDDAIELIKALGLYDVIEFLDSDVLNVLGIHVTGDDAVRAVWEIIINNITDGENDPLIKWLLKKLGEKCGFDISGFWTEVESKYEKLDHVENNKKEAKIKKIDYSNNAYLVIISAINSFDTKQLPEVSAWNKFSYADWFGKILVNIVIKCINRYASTIHEINAEWKKKANGAFNDIRQIDSQYANKINKSNEALNRLIVQMKSGI